MQLIIDGDAVKKILEEAIKRGYPVETITEIAFRESGQKDGEYVVSEVVDVVIECEIVQKLPRRKKTKT